MWTDQNYTPLEVQLQELFLIGIWSMVEVLIKNLSLMLSEMKQKELKNSSLFNIEYIHMLTGVIIQNKSKGTKVILMKVN
jgi:hypothetical protein